jgi:AAA ATPase domain
MSSLAHPPETDDGIAERIEQIRADWIAAIDPKALRWLALLPEWTDSLAGACEIPGGEQELLEELHKAARARLFEARQEESLGPETTVRFAMQESMRSWLLERWQKDRSVQLDRDIVDLASSVIAARGKGVRVSVGLQRWSELALTELEGKVVTGEALLDNVSRCIGAGKISDAFDWIFAGEALSQPLGVRMALASSRARRQINLLYRRSQDERHLRYFIQRQEQINAIERLLRSDSEWALHFIGPGGMGKTALMRFITSQLDDNPIRSASRVDFDYIDPRLPLENPARLLQELGEGLALDLTDSAQETLFRSFLEAVTEAEAARSGTDPKLVQPQNLPEFERAIAAFARFLRSLPGPVALVLDTCEELAKIHPPGEKMESISATFRILDRLHDAADELKVIVAGRRWLTWKYANESRLDDAIPQSVKRMEPFEFMQMQDVRGFTDGEMASYLEGRVPDLRLSTEMRAAIRTNTLNPARAPSLARFSGSRPQARYSPTDVALIGDWLCHQPDLEPKTLVDGNFDPYVEARIVERMAGDPWLLAALPMVMLLERFDGATIEPLLGENDATRKRVLAALIDEDWTHLEGGPEPEDIVIKVDPGLLPRLKAYYGRTMERRAVRDEARQRLEKRLLDLLEQAPGAASIESIGAALRLAPAEEAVAAFDRLAAQVAREPTWQWAETLCERLLSPDREPPLDPALQPSVWALYLSALRHRGAIVDLGSFWTAVEEIAFAHPDPVQAKTLAARGRLGALMADIANDGYDGRDATPALSRGRLVLDQLEPRRDEADDEAALPAGIEESVAPALLAAIEALIDAREERGLQIPVEAIDVCLARVRRAFRSEVLLEAHVLALAGRMHALVGDARAAHARFARLGRMRLPQGSEVPRFADWIAPDSIPHRVMLDLLRFRLREEEDSDGLLRRCEELCFEQDGGSDGAQLLSLVIQARLASGTTAPEQLERVAPLEQAVAGYRISSPVHRCAPPLFASLAEGWLGVGRADLALKLLGKREREATARRTDEHVTRAAALALLKVLRRLRLRERLALISHSTTADEELRGEALAAGALIVGLQPMLKRPIEMDHAAWRARNLLDDADPDLAPEFPEPGDSPARQDPAAADEALDRLESAMVFQRLRGNPGRVYAAEAHDAIQRLELGPTLCDPLGNEVVRLQLRADVLVPQLPLQPPTYTRQRQRAQLALEEGELMALRVPAKAVRLLRIAEEGFDAVGDHHGSFMASLLIAITEIHAGQGSAARQGKQAILARYEQLREDDPSLPPASSLGADGQPQREIATTHPRRAWVWRLSYYLSWAEGRADQAQLESVAMEFGPEFKLVPARGSTRGTIAPKARARTRGALRQMRATRWLPLVPLALGLLAFALSTDFLLLVAVTALVLVGLPLAIERIGPRLPRRVLPIGGFDVLLLAPPRAMGINSEVAAAWISITPWARAWPMRAYLWSLERQRPRRWSVMPVGADAGAAIAKPSPGLEQALRPRLTGGYPPLRLRVDVDFVQVSWERRLIAELTRSPEWDPSSSPPIWRALPLDLIFAPEWPEPISAVSARYWRQFLESSAGGGVRWLDDFEVLGMPGSPLGFGEHAPREGRGEARAVVALGTPVVTKAGWRLRLDDDELSALREERLEPKAQQLISPDALVKEAPLLAIVGRPDGRTLTPDRRLSDGLRALAHEAFMAGAYAVITVPVLPPRQTATVVDRLVAATRGWDRPPTTRELLSLRTSIQTDIYEAGSGDGEEAQAQRVELALDVCLFARGEGNRR